MRLNWPQIESTSDIPYYNDEFSCQLKQGIHELDEYALIIKDNAATEDKVSTDFSHRFLTMILENKASYGNTGEAHKVTSFQFKYIGRIPVLPNYNGGHGYYLTRNIKHCHIKNRNITARYS
jgi:hypothetical protein